MTRPIKQLFRRSRETTPSADPAPPSTPTPLRRLASASLFAGDTEIEIEHGSAVYRLRLTSLGKLILTK
ncbi:MAG: hemin uptake protein HemP [Burkholderiales bacterium]|nr:hemin uptake protein HemP [Burkholderiales bacterium]